MSSAFYVFPLHKLGDDGLEWLATLDFVHGVPGSAPAGQALPTVSDVVDVLRTNGCHGYACSTVDASGSWLPAVGDLDVGAVILHGDEPLDQGTSVDAVSLRRPDPAAVLRVACGLAPVAGPLVVHDEVTPRSWSTRANGSRTWLVRGRGKSPWMGALIMGALGDTLSYAGDRW